MFELKERFVCDSCIKSDVCLYVPDCKILQENIEKILDGNNIFTAKLSCKKYVGKGGATVRS